MENKSTLTKALAVIGTVLVWLPIAAPLIFSATTALVRGRFRFDYLMPAELFLVFVLGGGLLLWSAIRARSHRRLIGWALGTAIALLAAGQLLAVITGLASGAVEPGGWQWALVLISLAGYTLAVMADGIGGVLLLRDLFRPLRSRTSTS